MLYSYDIIYPVVGVEQEVKEIFFSILGGGQEIGPNCYYLNFGNKSILIDCGKVIRNGLTINPSFIPLLENQHSPKEIDSVFITHAHFDHVGYITELSQQCGNIPFYSSKLTSALSKVLLFDNLSDQTRHQLNFDIDRYTDRIIKSFASVGTLDYFSPIDFEGYRVTLFESGHIPGATMFNVEANGKNILFTGDFSLAATGLTSGAIIPDDFRADVIVIDGTCAKRPNTNNESSYSDALIKIQELGSYPISIRTMQLTKGIEVLQGIRKLIKQGKMKKGKIYLDQALWNVAMAFVECGIPVLDADCFALQDDRKICRDGDIFITTKGLNSYIKDVQIDFSLHAGFDELKEFIRKHAKKSVFIVHSPESNNYDKRFVKTLFEDGLPLDIDIIYPCTGDTYLI